MGHSQAVGETIAQEEQLSRDQLIEALMRQHEDSILRLCLVYLQDYHLAEDAMQGTFLKAYRGYDRFKGDSSLYTWLTRIAIYTCRDEHRSAWHRRVNRPSAWKTCRSRQRRLWKRTTP